MKNFNIVLNDNTIEFNSFYELDDSTQQQLADNYISDRNRVVYMQNDVVEFVLRQSYENSDTPFSYDDIENNDCYGVITINNCEYQLTEQERDEKLEFYEYLRDKAESVAESFNEKYDNNDELTTRLDDLVSKYSIVCDELESMDFDEYPEIYQWFLCDDLMIHKLSEYGECILDGQWWGRGSCGQSITLDSVIQKIAVDYYKNDNKRA